MARVTVEDSLQHVDNRFALVLLAAKRARDLMMSGVTPEVEEDNDKATVIALREIAAGKIKPDYLLRKAPEVVAPKSTYVLGEDDFDLDDDEANAALIAALSESAESDETEENTAETSEESESDEEVLEHKSTEV